MNMPADPLTKEMRDDYLQAILDTNTWSFTQSPEDKENKVKKALYRHNKRHGKGKGEGDTEVQPEEDGAA